jgi:HEPN domain-containing protein
MQLYRLQLVQREAEHCLEDARQLSKSGASSPFFNSAHLLSLLAFELLLKLVYEIELGKPPRNHKYDQMFSKLPREIQERLIALAEEQIGRAWLSVNLDAVLKEWAKNFIDLRYPYERYEGMTEAEYKSFCEDWKKRGAPLEGAQFRFYPEELRGMLHAVRIMANELANKLV